MLTFEVRRYCLLSLSANQSIKSHCQPTGMNMWTHPLTMTRHVTVLSLIQYLYCVASSSSNLLSNHCHLFPYCVTLNLNIHISVDTLPYPADTKRSANVVDGGPTLSQHWLNVLCWLIMQVRFTADANCAIVLSPLYCNMQ